MIQREICREYQEGGSELPRAHRHTTPRNFYKFSYLEALKTQPFWISMETPQRGQDCSEAGWGDPASLPVQIVLGLSEQPSSLQGRREDHSGMGSC
jgi:hypothetical protein